ncbi:MAG TPA: ATP-binding protein, partial [Dongiaceae bacterium]|nr:ATP-binding protein [Dongiaceae bacterium]
KQAAREAPGREFSEMRGGLGLALPLARRVIEAHGGRLWASPDVARGAIFQFTLPSGERS